MKRLITLSLALVLAFAFAACSAESSSSEATSSEPTTSSDATSTSGETESTDTDASEETDDTALTGYSKALFDARDAERNDAYHIIAKLEDGSIGITHAAGFLDTPMSDEEAESLIAMTQGIFNMDPANVTDFAYSVSFMNTQSYCVGIFMPAEGQKQAVLDMTTAFIDMQKQAQNNYLMDQYEIACNAIVEELPTGEIVFVMSADAETVVDAIKASLAA